MVFFVLFFASLNLGAYSSYFFPILKTQKPLKDLFFKRQASTYGSLIIDGSVTFLIGLYLLIVSIYVHECSSYWTDKFGVTKHSYNHDDNENCTVDAIVLSVAGLIGNILETYGQERGWFYNNKKYYISKKRHMFLVLIFQLMICLMCCWTYTAIYHSGLIQLLL